MTELTGHPVYRLLETKYDECQLDIVVLQPDGPYEGEVTHRRAVVEAFALLNRRARIANNFTACGFQVWVEPEKMEARPITWEELTWLPPNFPRTCKEKKRQVRELRQQGKQYCERWDVLSLGYAFLAPPYGLDAWGEDFDKLCQVLFPNRESLEILSWNDTWSNYFDDGNEWWGTACWSVYDRAAGIFVVIGASLTD